MLKACRTWFKQSGGGLYVPPDLILASTLKLDNDKLEVKIVKHPLVNALIRHHQWRVTPEYNDYALLEVKISGGSGKLSLPGNAAKYDITIPKSDDAIAYYFPNQDKKPLTIEVADKITTSSQIAILEGGSVIASPNLSGHTIKVRQRIVYNQATQELADKIDKIDACIVFKAGSDPIKQSWKYLQLNNCDFETVFGDKLVLKNWNKSREEFYEFSA